MQICPRVVAGTQHLWISHTMRNPRATPPNGVREEHWRGMCHNVRPPGVFLVYRVHRHWPGPEKLARHSHRCDRVVTTFTGRARKLRGALDRPPPTAAGLAT